MIVLIGFPTLIWVAVFFKTDHFRGIGKYLFLLFILLGHIETVYVNVSILQDGGIYLTKEAEADAVYMEGTISEIVELDFFQFPRFHGNGDKATGFEYYINEIKCTVPIRDELQVGDYVEVEYLPKSGYVLYINKVPEK